MIDQMATASEEQSATTDEISRNVTSIRTLAEKTANDVSHVNSAERDLANASENITQILANFKT